MQAKATPYIKLFIHMIKNLVFVMAKQIRHAILTEDEAYSLTLTCETQCPYTGPHPIPPPTRSTNYDNYDDASVFTPRGLNSLATYLIF